MQWAARNGQTQAIKTIMGHGVSINQSGTIGVTTLMDAVYNQEEFFESLATLSASSALTLICSAICITTSNVL